MRIVGMSRMDQMNIERMEQLKSGNCSDIPTS